MKKKKLKKKNFKKILIIEIVVILLLAVGFKFYKSLRDINYDASQDDEITDNEINNPNLTGYRTIVLFGVDSRQNKVEKTTHSDTIILVSINNKTKDVKMASVYRDTYVNIPDRGYNKINDAYFRGGYSLALNTINKNFDLNAKEYVTVSFRALVDTIDKLGGITLDVQQNELKYLNGYVRELNRINGTNVSGLKQAGTQVVNGTQATAYARIRFTAGGDFKRAERQRIVVQKIFDKVKTSDLVTINKVINDVLPQISTNLKTKELLRLAKDVFSYNISGETGFPFEKDAHNYNRVSYVFPIDLQANVIRLHEFLYDTPDYVPTAAVQENSLYIETIRKK